MSLDDDKGGSLMAETDRKTETAAEKCRAAHSDHGNANCTGVCQGDKGHSGKHKDQMNHEY